MHESVLLKEAIFYLNLKENSIVVDCTLGYGGHSSSILKEIKKGFLFAFDQDIDAITYSKERLSKIDQNFEKNVIIVDECQFLTKAQAHLTMLHKNM